MVSTVIVVVPEVVTVAGLKEAVAPVGRPLTLNDTVPLKPFEGVTVGTYVVLVPWTMVRVFGAEVSAKSPAAVVFTTRVTVEVFTKLPLVPVMVSV